jgi:2-polyprenyl-6-methoxyphenol hydroxylase-like FAD-dependent oxidoreductase
VLTERSAIVVGGGIGGLATAVALTSRGWQVRVLERAPDFTEVGAGISLWANALHALDAIGLGAQVGRLGTAEIHGGIQCPTGRWLSRSDIAEVASRYGQVTMLHRAELLRVLLDAVAADCLVPGAEVVSVEETGQRMTVTHSQGRASADLLVGADGLRSTVRGLLWPDAPAPRYAGYTTWRMVTPPLPNHRDRAGKGGGTTGGETWGTTSTIFALCLRTSVTGWPCSATRPMR